MKVPLICLICALLIVTSINYLPASTCADSNKTALVVSVTTCEVAGGSEVTLVAICEVQDREPSSGLDAVKSSLRAGVTVGKALVRTAVVVSASMGRAALHAAAALVETAYKLG
jgi:hypothetical protein